MRIIDEGMKRRGFVGSVVGAGGIVNAFAEGEGVDKKLMLSPPVMMAPREDGLEIVWAVSKLCRGRVELRGGAGDVWSQSADAFGMTAQGGKVLKVRLNGLTAGAAYYYRAITEEVDGEGEESSGWRQFRTLNPKQRASSFVVWNDTHEHHETIRKLEKGTPAADFLIWNGDICNDWHKEEWLVPTVLNPAGQDISVGRPLAMVFGNHDARGKWAFQLPDVLATPNGRAYYAFRSGPIAVICLHTGEDKPDNHPSFGGRVAFEQLRREQAVWLEKVTRQPEMSEAPYRVVFCHIPLRWKKERKLSPDDYKNGKYDSYSRMSRDHWHQTLVDWKAQVVISGHMHQVAHIPANDEFPYAQIVGGGPKLNNASMIEGKADEESLVIKVADVEGRKLEEVTFKPLAK